MPPSESDLDIPWKVDSVAAHTGCAKKNTHAAASHCNFTFPSWLPELLLLFKNLLIIDCVLQQR